jgi:formylglycine-generating enzyme
MRVWILILSVTVFFGAIPAYAGLFDVVKEDKDRNEQIRRLIKSEKATIKSISALKQALSMMQMQKGDCAPALEIEGKAKSGDAEYQYMLVVMYKNGLCVNKSKTKMFTWLKRSADQNYLRAVFELGVAFFNGEGTEKNHSLARSLWIKAAEKGNNQAANNIGRLYRDGIGVPKNIELAGKWYERAIKMGNQDAAFQLGSLHLEGKFTGHRDPDSAIQILRPVAEQGDLNSQLLIAGALMLRNALAPDKNRKDLVEGYKWANLLSASNKPYIVKSAKSLKDSFEKAMTVPEIIMAQRESTSWKPKSSRKKASNKKKNKKRELPKVNSRLSDGLEKEQARTKLRELDVPIKRKTFRKAIMSDNLGLVKLFLAAGANKNTPLLKDRDPPIYIATDYGARKVFDYLLAQGVDTDIGVQYGSNALHRAFINDRPYMIDKLLKAGTSAKQKIDANGNPFWDSVLYYATSNLTMKTTINKKFIRRLLKNGASVRERYISGYSPLMKVVGHSHDLVEEFLLHGANPNHINKKGRSILQVALQAQKPINPKTLILLLKAGANPSGGKSPLTPLLLATIIGDPRSVRLLLSFGANPNQRYKISSNESPANMPKTASEIIENGGTVLMLAAYYGHASAVKLLLSKGADRNALVKLSGKLMNAFDIANAQNNKMVTELLKASGKKFRKTIKGKDGALMVHVPAGWFIMGSNSARYSNERPQRRVYLDGFYIDKYLVTNTRFRASGMIPTKDFGSGFNGESQPIIGVTWHQVKAYCEKIGKRLPTEAEWEKAARGTNGREYPWGSSKDSSKFISRRNARGKTHPVNRSYSTHESLYGAVDMAGHVWQWLNDWYNEDYYKSAPKRNPKGANTGSRRVLRGGSWDDGFFSGQFRAAHRFRLDPIIRNITIGFRCAKDAG